MKLRTKCAERNAKRYGQSSRVTERSVREARRGSERLADRKLRSDPIPRQQTIRGVWSQLARWLNSFNAVSIDLLQTDFGARTTRGESLLNRRSGDGPNGLTRRRIEGIPTLLALLRSRLFRPNRIFFNWSTRSE